MRKSNVLPLSACVVAVACGLVLAGCGKKKDHPASDVATQAPPAAMAPAPDVAAPSPVVSADQAEHDAELAKKQKLLDYATMEDGYINDPHAQWASSAKASSTFGEGPGRKPSESSLPTNLVGPPDGNTWTNNSQNIGFDWLQADFAKPVHATEIRVIFAGGEGVEAVNKLEVQDVDGGWTTVWSGLSDTKADGRGQRTWFVRQFDATAKPVKTVKVTIANNVQTGYKVVDAVQLVGE